MIVGYISALELSNLERSGTCQISKEPRDGVVCEALFDAQPSRARVLCGCCNGTGQMVRDPDIGTDQECFVCGGSGEVDE